MFKNFRTYSIFQIAYLIFFAALPFFYSDALIDPVAAPRQAFLSLFLVFICAALFFKKKAGIDIFQNRLSFTLLFLNALFVLLSFVSCIYAHSFSESLYVSSKYAIVFSFLVTTFFLLSAKLLVREDLVNSVFIFCAVSVCYGFVDILSLLLNSVNILTNSSLITSLYANKNLFASILMLSVWAAIAVKLPFVVRILCLVILVFLILLLQSKIVLLGTVLILLALGLKNIAFLKQNKKIVMLSGVLLIVFLVFLLFNFSRFANLASLHTLDTRLALWKNSFAMFSEKPFGVGSGNWQIFFPKYGLSHFDLDAVKNGSTIGRQPHNDFIWILCELGIQGFVIYLTLFVLLFSLQIKTYRKTKDPFMFLLFITSVAYCLVAFFDFPLERIEHQVVLAIIISISLHSYDSSQENIFQIKPLNYFVVTMVIILLSGIISFYRIKGEYFTHEALSYNRKKNPELLIENCDKAKSVFYQIDPVGIPLDWYAGMALVVSDKTESAKLRIEKALNSTPYNIRILKRLGDLYLKEGKREEAITLYTKVVLISPTAVITPLK